MHYPIQESKLGIIKKTRRLHEKNPIPENLVGYSAEVNDISHYYNWEPDIVGTGFFFDKQSAKEMAIGEAIERYCGNFIPDNLHFSSEEDLKAQNLSFISHNELFPFSSTQENINKYFKKIKSDEKSYWIQGKNLKNNNQILIPAPYVYLNFNKYFPESYSQPVLLSGIAAEKTLDNAIQNSLLEIIERDTTMLWWLANEDTYEIILDKHLEKEIGQYPEYIHLEFFLIHNDFSVYVVGCKLVDTKNKFICIGFSSKLSLKRAIKKAAAEAFQLRKFSLDLIDQNSFIWKENMYDKILGLKKFRENRNYLDSFNKNFEDFTSLMHNVQYYLDTRTWKAIEHKFNHKKKLKYTKLINNLKKDEIINNILNSENFFYVDLTTEDVERLGYKVVRVISPNMCPNLPNAFPPLGNKRLDKQLKKYNMKDFNPLPLPHS